MDITKYNIKILEQNKSYLGFIKSKLLKKFRIKSILDKQQIYSNLLENQEYTTLMRKDFILYILLNRYYPKLIENYTKVNSKTLEETKPKTVYKMYNKDKNLYWKITKTEYNFAEYLINNNFDDIENIHKFIEREKEEKLLEEQEKIKIEEQKRITAENEKKFENWLEDEAFKYHNKEKIDIARMIFLDLIHKYDYTSNKILVLIDNIEKDMCKNKLISYLANHNKASRKTFEHITGLTLPSKNKDLKDFIYDISTKDFRVPNEYKVSKNLINKNKRIFYVNCRNYTSEVLAEPLITEEIEENKFFIREMSSHYEISDTKYGILICTGNTKDEAINALRLMIKERSIEGLEKQIENIFYNNKY